MEIFSEGSPVFKLRLNPGPPKYEIYEAETDVPPIW